MLELFDEEELVEVLSVVRVACFVFCPPLLHAVTKLTAVLCKR